MVTVRATHRRQGILRAMMRSHLDSAVARGEPLAGLWASEPDIYGRFGFGLAVESHEIKLDSRRSSFAAADDSVNMALLAPDDIVDVVSPFWRALAES